MNIKKALSIGIILGILFIGLFITLFLKSRSEYKKSLSKQDTEERYRYDFITNFNQDGWTFEKTDGRIVRIDKKTGTIEDMIDSIKFNYPDEKRRDIDGFRKLNSSKRYLYLTTNQWEGCYGIVRYDSQNNTLTEHPQSHLFDCHSAKASEDSPYIAYVTDADKRGDSRSVYLINLDKNSTELINLLPLGQTYNNCVKDCYRPVIADINWIDKDRFQINAYDSTKILTDEYNTPYREIVSERIYNINQ